MNQSDKKAVCENCIYCDRGSMTVRSARCLMFKGWVEREKTCQWFCPRPAEEFYDKRGT